VDWGPTVLVSGMVGFQATKHLRFSLEGFNLLDREDDDIAYYYASRLPGEPAEGIEDVHFHPMEKPSVRLTATWTFCQRPIREPSPAGRHQTEDD